MARWGGEEFFIILPKTGKVEAEQIAEFLRVAIEKIKFGRIGHITCSFGVASFDIEDSKNSFIERVDKAMYLAKSKGRNRVEVL